MKILFITEFFPDLKKLNFSGGVETRTFYIAKNLAKEHKVIVISRRKKQELKKEARGSLKIFRLGRETTQIEANFYSIFSRLIFIVQSFIIGLKFKPDLIEGSNFVCYPVVWLLAKFKKIPYIAWYPDLLGREWLKNFGFFTGLIGLFLERFSLLLPWTKIIALSCQTKKKLIKAGKDKKKIVTIYGGVEFALTSLIKKKDFKKPVICSIGRLVPYKNLDYLIKAMPLIKKKIQEAKLVIIGKGPEESNLKRLVKKLKMRNTVCFKKDLPYQELLSILKGSKVFSLPSEIEGFGLSIIEAASLGVPFVVADLPITREVTKGKGGLFYKKGEPQDLARKIIKILENRSLYLKLQKETRELAGLYSWSKISRQTERVYQGVLKRP